MPKNFLTETEDRELGQLGGQIYRHILANFFPTNSRIAEFFTGKTFYRATYLMPGATLTERVLRGGATDWTLAVETDTLKISFNCWLHSLTVHVRVGKKWVDVTTDDGPWVDETRRLIQNIGHRYKLLLDQPDDRAKELAGAAAVFSAKPAKRMKSNPLSSGRP